MRNRYHDLMVSVWLWLFDHAPTQGLALICIAKASDHTYATWTPEDEDAIPAGDGERPF